MKELNVIKTLSKPQALSSTAPAVGQVMDVQESGWLILKMKDGSEIRARMVAELGKLSPEFLLGQQVLIFFEDNDPEKAIALAQIYNTGRFSDMMQTNHPNDSELNTRVDEVRVDGERILIQARKKLELRCGKASIVIDANGKVTISGASLLNRSTGPIRIKGGHVEIN